MVTRGGTVLMNKIFRLLLSTNEDDIMLAGELLKCKENEEIQKKLQKLYNYIGQSSDQNLDLKVSIFLQEHIKVKRSIPYFFYNNMSKTGVFVVRRYTIGPKTGIRVFKELAGEEFKNL